jgi:hypothetical protein
MLMDVLLVGSSAVDMSILNFLLCFHCSKTPYIHTVNAAKVSSISRDYIPAMLVLVFIECMKHSIGLTFPPS